MSLHDQWSLLREMKRLEHLPDHGLLAKTQPRLTNVVAPLAIQIRNAPFGRVRRDPSINRGGVNVVFLGNHFDASLTSSKRRYAFDGGGLAGCCVPTTRQDLLREHRTRIVLLRFDRLQPCQCCDHSSTRSTMFKDDHLGRSKLDDDVNLAIKPNQRARVNFNDASHSLAASNRRGSPPPRSWRNFRHHRNARKRHPR